MHPSPQSYNVWTSNLVCLRYDVGITLDYYLKLWQREGMEHSNPETPNALARRLNFTQEPSLLQASRSIISTILRIPCPGVIVRTGVGRPKVYLIPRNRLRRGRAHKPH